MPVKLNPTKLSWVPPSKYVDGSAFGATDFAGYELGYRPLASTTPFTGAVAIPVAFNITSVDLATLTLPQNTDLELAMRTLAKNGQASDWSNFVEVRFDTRRPLAPSGLAVA